MPPYADVEHLSDGFAWHRMPDNLGLWQDHALPEYVFHPPLIFYCLEIHVHGLKFDKQIAPESGNAANFL